MDRRPPENSTFTNREFVPLLAGAALFFSQVGGSIHFESTRMSTNPDRVEFSTEIGHPRQKVGIAFCERRRVEFVQEFIASNPPKKR